MDDSFNNIPNIHDINNGNAFSSPDEVKTQAVIKRTEKIVSAVCLVTNFLSDNDPLKWVIRDKSVTLLSNLFSAVGQSVFSKSGTLAQTSRLINEIVSLVEVAALSKLISEMNASIIKKELISLKSSVEDINSVQDSSHQFLLSGLFGEETSGNNHIALGNGQNDSSQKQNIKDKNYKGHSDKGHLLSHGAGTVKKVQAGKPKDRRNGAEEKNARKISILNLFKKNKELTIKDISSAISGCSEKTIQRELNLMLKDKTIRKEGEKRWSKYYLNRG